MGEIAPIEFRRIALGDQVLITRHRYLMFEEMGWGMPQELADMRIHYLEWVDAKIQLGEYAGTFAVHNHEVVGGAGLWLCEWHPTPSSTTTQKALLTNVYVEPEFRRQGIAMRLVQMLIDLARDENIPQMVLHASDEGRGLYEALGFAQTNEMQLTL